MRCDTCSRPEGLPCLGERVPHLCGREDYRDYVAGHDPTLIPVANWPPIDPAVRDAVNACEFRGAELPMSDPAYASGCCGTATLWSCGAGKGSWPGKVTLQDCLTCKSEAPS